MYLLYGTSKVEIDEEIKKIIKEHNIENVIKYTLEESSLDDVIIDAGYLDMFGGKKCIIATDSYFLTSNSKIETDALSEYLKNPNEEVVIIFVLYEEKLDERKKIVKELKSKAKVCVFNEKKSKSIEEVINKSLKEDDYKIESDALKEFVARLGGNTDSVFNELDKLKMYKVIDKFITFDDIVKIVPKQLEDDVFALVNAIGRGDKKQTLDIYNELMLAKKEPLMIISLLENTFRLYLSIKILLEEGKNKYEINEILKEHPYRIDLGIKECASIKKSSLIKYLTQLYELDKSIKTGNGNSSLEMFILDL